MITYNVVIRDTLEGYEFTYDWSEDVHEAIETHKCIQGNGAFLRDVLLDTFDNINIDQYHMDHPHKRFDVVIEVSYDD